MKSLSCVSNSCFQLSIQVYLISLKINKKQNKVLMMFYSMTSISLRGFGVPDSYSIDFVSLRELRMTPSLSTFCANIWRSHHIRRSWSECFFWSNSREKTIFNTCKVHDGVCLTILTLSFKRPNYKENPHVWAVCCFWLIVWLPFFSLKCG